VFFFFPCKLGGEDVLTMTIDAKRVEAEEGWTILQVAKTAGIRIPTLCYLEGLSSPGMCRLCLVEIRSQRGRLAPACVTPAEEGMEVVTNTERLQNIRRLILELIFAERNHICAVCAQNGHCELQDLACELGMEYVRIPYRFPGLSLDATHAKFLIDHNRCVLCGRCMRACSEVEGAMTWGFSGRGVFMIVEPDLGGPWQASPTCTECGKCVQACPVGAIVAKGMGAAEQVKQPEVLAQVTERRPRVQD
jgi:bidirectional [NiFe] hydrogenase diaphorase subunit